MIPQEPVSGSNVKECQPNLTVSYHPASDGEYINKGSQRPTPHSAIHKMDRKVRDLILILLGVCACVEHPWFCLGQGYLTLSG